MMSSIKIVHVNTNDTRGGAARAAYRLHSALINEGIASNIFVQKRKSNDPNVSALNPSAGWFQQKLRQFRSNHITRDFSRYDAAAGIDYDFFSDDRSVYGAEVLAQFPSCDLVNLHWISSFIDYRTFFREIARRRIPAVWTLHDMNPLTGGCHYNRGCERFLEGCGACPQLKSSDANDLSRQIWLRKQAALENLPNNGLHLVALCQWMADEARRSQLLQRFPISIIPNSLDTTVFAPRNRQVAREIFQIPPDRKVALFVAGSLKDVRKGMELLQQALVSACDTPNLMLASVGHAEWTANTNIPHRSLGAIDDDRLLSFAYSAADLFVIPSLQDNLPNTVMEALSCGTPVVGFAVGGIPDMVRPGVTGALAPPNDAAALGATIASLLNQPERLAEMSAQCRRIALAEYGMNTQAHRYMKLYQTICHDMRMTK